MDGLYALILPLVVAAIVILAPMRIHRAEKSKIDEICERWGMPRPALREWANSRGIVERRALAILREYRSELESLHRTDVWDLWRHDLTRLERELEKLRFAAERSAIEKRPVAAT